MKKILHPNRVNFMLVFIITIIAGLLIFYPKGLLKVRSNTQGDVSIFNDLDTIVNIVISLNDSIYVSKVAANSSSYFKIIHKIKNNEISINYNNSTITQKDTFSLPWNEGCGIYVGLDNPIDSIGKSWDNDSTVILFKDNYGGLYLRKPKIVIKNNIRLKYSVQQSRFIKIIN